MPSKLTARVRNLKPSATFRLARRAAELRESGQDVISFGLGEPDFATPEKARVAAHDAIESGKTHYTANEGILPLRTAIRNAFEADQGVGYQAAGEVLVTAGAKQAIAHALLALVEKGDEVLVPAPFWLTYPEAIVLCDGVMKSVATRAEDGFHLDAAQLDQACTDRSKVLILNSPNNPTGAVLDRGHLEAIAEVVCRRDLMVISDEIYGPLTYEGRSHISIAAISPELADRTIVCHGFSKAFAMTGWRLGYALGRAEYIGAMGRIQGHTTSNACSISQYAAIAALEQCGDQTRAMRDEFARRRELTLERLAAIEGLAASPPEGAFYVFPRITDLIGSSTPAGQEIRDSSTFCEALLDEALVSVVPGLVFGADDCIRISYAASDEMLNNGLDRIGNFVAGLRRS